MWHAHFDTKGLIAVIAGSCVVFALDIISVGLVIAGNKTSGKVRLFACRCHGFADEQLE